MKNAAKGWRRSYCRPCCRDYGREHYARNVVAYVRGAGLRSAVQRTRNRRLIADHLASRSCVDCGETDPLVLEFDHRDPSSKTHEVARLISTGRLEVLRAEIDKCDVRCANCHRIRTATQFGSYRLRIT